MRPVVASREAVSIFSSLTSGGPGGRRQLLERHWIRNLILTLSTSLQKGKKIQSQAVNWVFSRS